MLQFRYVVVKGLKLSPAEKIAIKNKLKQAGLALIEQRIAASRLAADQAQQAANQEEKSSAGDKYETARAMGHLQKDMHAGQLVAHLKDLASLRAVNTDIVYSSPGSGAFIQCHTFSFFIAAGLGKQLIDAQTIFFISPYAPLARLLAQKKTGDSFSFNGANVIIEAIY